MRKVLLVHLDPLDCRESWDRKGIKETHVSAVRARRSQVYLAQVARKGSEDLLEWLGRKVKRVSLASLVPLADLELKAPQA